MSFGSLVTGVSGLKANQQALDSIGNNLANSNTVGFKSQRVRFADLVYQTLSAATGASGATGGTNPLQTGFGAKTAAIDSILTQGSLEPSGSDLDMGIQGNGFFVVNDGTSDFYTRAGAFAVDGNNLLVDSATGFTVQRFGAVGEGTATSPAFQTSGDNRIHIPFGSGIPGEATTSVNFQGNLDANAAIGTKVSTAIQVFDTQGTQHVLSVEFEKTAVNTWNMTGSVPAGEGTLTDAAAGPIVFNDDGSFQSSGDVTFTAQFNNMAVAQTLTLNLGTAGAFGGLTQFGGESSATAQNQDGFAAGFLTSVNVAKDGTISGVFTNGKILPLAQMALANFANSAGLSRTGNNLFSVTAQSGAPLIGAGQSGGRGSVQAGVLEGSNVDVALEFTRLIIAQRGFQVNARTITVANEVLQELATIIR